MLGILTLTCVSMAQVTVSTAQYSPNRTGTNESEILLKPGNITAASFGKLFVRTVDASVYALPLYIPNISIPGKGVRNVLYVATMANTVYAFDADNPAATEPLWKRTLATPPPGDSWIGPVTRGILSTPVVDLATGTLYAVAHVGTVQANGLYLCA